MTNDEARALIEAGRKIDQATVTGYDYESDASSEWISTNLSVLLTGYAEALDEVDAVNAKLRRLYNAMCSAMVNWEPPDPSDARMSDAEWARVGKAQETAWRAMTAVFDASPGVLYVPAMEPKP